MILGMAQFIFTDDFVRFSIVARAHIQVHALLHAIVGWAAIWIALSRHRVGRSAEYVIAVTVILFAAGIMQLYVYYAGHGGRSDNYLYRKGSPSWPFLSYACSQVFMLDDYWTYKIYHLEDLRSGALAFLFSIFSIESVLMLVSLWVFRLAGYRSGVPPQQSEQES